MWRLPGEENQPGCTKSSVKFPQSVMVWGAMAVGGVGQLCFLKSNVNVEVYQQVLEYFMLPAEEEIFGCTDFTFQQDLAPAPGARSTMSTMRWLEDHDIEVLPCPANSPDLNPMENLWGLVKRILSRKRPSTQEELKDAIRKTWNSVTSEDCYRLVSSMARRIQTVIAAKGAATKYSLF